MQKGVRVELAVTNNASPMPEADNADAWIVAVTQNGSLYFGVDLVTPDGLLEEMIRRPRNREQKLYIKADSRAPLADIQKALAAARVDLFQEAVLLTSQAESAEPGAQVSPKGFDVLIGPTVPAGIVATVVQLLDSAQRPVLKINDDPVSWSALQTILRQHFQKGDEKVVLLKADGQMPFAHLARAIGICRSAGARVVLFTPER
jgi:biopolymer transport protein ExbD